MSRFRSLLPWFYYQENPIWIKSITSDGHQAIIIPNPGINHANITVSMTFGAPTILKDGTLLHMNGLEFKIEKDFILAEPSTDIGKITPGVHRIIINQSDTNISFNLDGTDGTSFIQTNYNYNKGIAVFSDINMGSLASFPLYSMQLYESKTIINNLRPCINPYTMEYCLYDTIGGKYYTNKLDTERKFQAGEIIYETKCITSNKSGYVLTEIVPNDNTELEMKMQATIEKVDDFYAGVYDKGGGTNYYIGRTTESGGFSAGFADDVGIGKKRVPSDLSIAMLNKDGLYIDSKIEIPLQPKPGLSTKNPIILFTASGSGSYTTMDIHYAKIRRLDTGILDFDGMAAISGYDTFGIYDWISGSMAESVGTLEYKAPFLPKGYTCLQYIESPSPSQASIMTDLMISSSTRFSITFQSTRTLERFFAGSLNGGSQYTDPNNFSLTYMSGGSYSVYCDGDAGNNEYAWRGGKSSDRLKHTIVYYGDNNTAPTLDGTAMTQATSKTMVPLLATVPWTLFGRSLTPSTVDYGPAGLRIYEFKGDNFHFVPCRNNRGEIGFYDIIRRKFFGKTHGNYDFTAGPVA